MLTRKKTIGNFGEQLAADFLVARGYSIVAKNQKIGRWEFDLIARQNDRTVFVEIKTLAFGTSPAETALSRRQIEILLKAMQYYCWQNKVSPLATRLDLISVNINRIRRTARIRHYRNIV